MYMYRVPYIKLLLLRNAGYTMHNKYRVTNRHRWARHDTYRRGQSEDKVRKLWQQSEFGRQFGRP